MDFRRRIRALEKKVGVEEPREEIIDFGEGQVPAGYSEQSL